jgi:hypothetical protein
LGCDIESCAWRERMMEPHASELVELRQRQDAHLKYRLAARK